MAAAQEPNYFRLGRDPVGIRSAAIVSEVLECSRTMNDAVALVAHARAWGVLACVCVVGRREQ